MKYSDIQLTDKTIWENYKTAWADGEYATVLAVLLSKKKLTAELLNELTAEIVRVEELNDQNFKADKIKVSSTAPTGLQNGDVYFETY